MSNELYLPDLYSDWNKARENGRQRKLGQQVQAVMPDALAGKQDALKRLLGLDAQTGMEAQKYVQGQQQLAHTQAKDARDEFGELSAVYASLGDSPDAAQLFPKWRETGVRAGFIAPDAPNQYDPGSHALAQKVASVYKPQQGDEGVVIGSNLVGKRSGKVMYQGTPQRKLVEVPDGNGGTVQMEYDGQNFYQPNYGGAMPAPTTGAGPEVMGGALQDAVGSLISPLGGRITSTTGGRHNPGSKHYSGGAIDVGMGRESPEQQAQILAALQADPSLIVRDERQRPPGQKVWGGPHLHVERAQNGARLGYKPPKPAMTEAQRLSAENAAARLKLAQDAAARAERIAAQKPAGKPLPGNIVTALTKQAETADNLTALSSGFKDNYAGNSVTGGLENVLGRMGAPLATPGQAEWWQAYDRQKNVVRNELFGASLTPGEQRAFEAADITPAMSPAVIRKNLALQQQIIQRGLARQAKVWTAQGYNTEAVNAATAPMAPAPANNGWGIRRK